MRKIWALLLFFCLFLQMPVLGAERMLWPVDGYYNISSGYGKRTGSIHRGIDISGYGGLGSISGKTVQAAQAGRVTAVNRACIHNYGKKESCGCGGGYGNFVFVTHRDGSVARYAHLAEVEVSPGQNVGRGDVLGTVGSTGKSSGFHLHFELRDAQGNPYNPMPQNGEERHTYVGSSAPFSQSIEYVYTIEQISARAEEDKIFVTLHEKDTSAWILVAQYQGERLVSVDAGVETDVFTKTKGADRGKVMLWKGIYPLCGAVSLTF